MVTSIMLGLSIVAIIVAALYLRQERRKLEELLDSDLNIYVYLDEDGAGLAHPLDVYSKDIQEKRRNAKWN